MSRIEEERNREYEILKKAREPKNEEVEVGWGYKFLGVVLGLIMLAVITTGSLLFALVLAAYFAWILTYLWSWFVTPLFGLPLISMAQAYGLMMVIAFVKGYMEPWKKNNENQVELKEFFSLVIARMIGGLVSLGIGYLVYTHFILK